MLRRYDSRLGIVWDGEMQGWRLTWNGEAQQFIITLPDGSPMRSLDGNAEYIRKLVGRTDKAKTYTHNFERNLRRVRQRHAAEDARKKRLEMDSAREETMQAVDCSVRGASKPFAEVHNNPLAKE